MLNPECVCSFQGFGTVLDFVEIHLDQVKKGNVKRREFVERQDRKPQ